MSLLLCGCRTITTPVENPLEVLGELAECVGDKP